MSSHSEEWKGEPEMVDVTHAVTVDPLPKTIVAEAGLVVDTENLASTEGLKLAKDGHVCRPT